MWKCEHETLNILRRLAHFCTDGEAIEVTVRDDRIIVRSLDYANKKMIVRVSPECATFILNILKIGPVLE